MRVCDRNTVVLAFVNALNQDVKMFSIKRNESFKKRNKQSSNVYNNSRLIFILQIATSQSKNIIAKQIIFLSKVRLLE